MQRWLTATAPFLLRRQCRCIGRAWKPLEYSTKSVNELEEKRTKALEGGGEKRVAKQHKTVECGGVCEAIVL